MMTILFPENGIRQTWMGGKEAGASNSGKEQDPESSLYYFGARYYDPTLYRFLSPDPQQIPAIARFEINRFNKYFFANNNPISYFEFSGLWAIIHKETKIINASYMSYLGKSIEGKDVYMKGFGMTNVLPEDLKIDLSKETGITVSVTFTIFILAKEDIQWKQEDAIVGHNNYENVLRHELTHVYDILLMVSLALNKIEAQWKAGKISDEEARKLVNKAFIRASKASSSLRDDWGVEWFKWLINWFEELKPEHNYSAFWEWLLTPYIYFLMKCN
ncbi:MAG: RHS repeat-associated core domain-containing protein [Candidatus Saccharicenans sp.]|jgi:RHS repeat-associated protein|nr:RHS repeat-associated core domain-containing protein [Candidatus Saccharicenans sp.]MDH7575821.1 RHS repeat-associated core domain-containing protein [Candidatus Saccharicenans sp.]